MEAQMGKRKEAVKSVLQRWGLLEPVRNARQGMRSLSDDTRRRMRAAIWNVGPRLVGARDGYRIPGPRLIFLVIGSTDVASYLASGALGHGNILYALRKNGIAIESLGSILDFGCGCGRIIRHWVVPTPKTKLHGSDYNPVLVDWCRTSLSTLARFSQNQLEPPLEYSSGQFDFVYTISIFTHLTEALQHAWMSELRRVLRPGGLLLLTVHGESRVTALTPHELERFRCGELVVRHWESAGRNECGAYHPEAYVRTTLARGFEVVDFLPRGASDADQDMYLLRKAGTR
jgi:SAM-dependent methyltransferase